MAGPRRRTVRDLRRNNRATVLRKLYFDGPLSRQELGPLTALSSGSISNVVSELVADGLLEEAGSVDSDGGRPRTLLRVAPHCGHLAGVDIGETRVRVELFDLTLNELARVDAPLPDGYHDAQDVVRIVAAGLAQVLDEAKVAPDALIGVGIGVPGIVDASDAGGAVGAVVHGQAIGWDAVPFEAMLRDRGELPPELALFVDNGAKTLGLAEMWFGAGRGARTAVVTLIGSGVGACVIADGVPYQGSSGSAGEWGHTTLQVGGRRCRCGARGCLEAYVGAEALLERWRESGGHWTSTDEEGRSPNSSPPPVPVNFSTRRPSSSARASPTSSISSTRSASSSAAGPGSSSVPASWSRSGGRPPRTPCATRTRRPRSNSGASDPTP